LCVLAVVACSDGDGSDRGAPGGDAPTETSATDEAPGAGREAAGRVYTGELADGSTLTVHLDVTADHPAVAPFAAFQARTGAPTPTWIVAEITVPDGVDGTGRFLTLVEPGADRMADDPADRTDGVTTADFACSVLEDWFGQVTDKDQELTDAFMEVYDGPCGGQAHQVLAPGGETTTYVLVYEGDLPELDAIESELGNELRPA
jgi:hypothetical protein